VRKLLLINLLVFAGLLALAETAAGLLQSHQGQPLALVRFARQLRSSAAPEEQTPAGCSSTTSWSPSSPFQPDPLLGYRYRPNALATATIRLNQPIQREGIVGPVDRYAWQLSTGAQGERLSRPRSAPAPARAAPAVLLLGDSFILGAGLSDSSSLGWQLQSLLPRHQVANYAGGGYGTIHQLLLLRDATGPRRLIPPALAKALRSGDVLLGYADFYPRRNVAAPSRLRTFQPRCSGLQPRADQAKAFFHPRASLRQGQLQIEPVPLFQPHTGPDPSQAEQNAVTIALLDEALTRVQQLGARPTILWIEGRSDSAPIQHLRRRGVRILDLRNPGNGLWSHDTLMPFDNHPGPLTASTWAHSATSASYYQPESRRPSASCRNPAGCIQFRRVRHW
jgi:hypothetical protein